MELSSFDSFESGLVRVDPSFVQTLAKAAYTLSSNEISRSLLLILSKLSGRSRRSHESEVAPSNMSSTLSEVRMGRKRQRFYGEGILLSIELAIDDERKGILLLPAESILHDCLRVLDIEEGESSTELAFLSIQAYRIIKCFFLNMIESIRWLKTLVSDSRRDEEEEGDAADRVQDNEEYQNDQDDEQRSTNLKTDMILGLLIASECKWLSKEWRQDAQSLWTSFQRILISRHHPDISLALKAISKGLCHENLCTNQACIKAFQAMVHSCIEQRSFSMLNRIARKIVQVMDVDGEWISKQNALKCIRYLIEKSDELDQNRAFFNSEIVLNMLEACGSVPLTLYDDCDFGTSDDAFEVLKIILNVFMRNVYLAKSSRFTLSAIRTLMYLCLNRSKKYRERAFKLLQKFCTDNLQLIFCGSSNQYSAEVVNVVESLVKLTFGYFPGNTHCAQIHGLSLIAQLQPSVLNQIADCTKGELLRHISRFIDRTLPATAWSHIKFRLSGGLDAKCLKLSALSLFATLFPQKALDPLVNLLNVAVDDQEKLHIVQLLETLSSRGFSICAEKSIKLIRLLGADQSIPTTVFALLLKKSEIPESVKFELITNKCSLITNHIRAICLKLQDPAEVFFNNPHLEHIIDHSLRILYSLTECPNSILAEIISTVSASPIITRLSKKIHASLLDLLAKNFKSSSLDLLINDETICKAFYTDLFLQLTEHSGSVRLMIAQEPMIVLKIMQMYERRPDGSINRVPALKLGTRVTYLVAQYDEHRDWFISSECLLRNFSVVWNHNTPATTEWCTGCSRSCSYDDPKTLTWTSYSNLRCTRELCWIVLRIIARMPNESFNLLLPVFERCFDDLSYYSCSELMGDFLNNSLPTLSLEWKRALFKQILLIRHGTARLDKRLRCAHSVILAGLYPCLKKCSENGELDEVFLEGKSTDPKNLIAQFCTELLDWIDSIGDVFSVDFYNLKVQCLRMISFFASNTPDYVIGEVYDSMLRFARFDQHTDPLELYECECAIAHLLCLSCVDEVNATTNLKQALLVYAHILKERTARSIRLYDHEAINTLISKFFGTRISETYTLNELSKITSDCLMRAVHSPLHKQRILAIIVKHSSFYAHLSTSITNPILSAITELAQCNATLESMSLCAHAMMMIVEWEEKNEYMADIVADYFSLTVFRLFNLIKLVKEFDCSCAVKELKDVWAKSTQLGITDNVISRSSENIFTNLVSVPDDPKPHQLFALATIAQCLLNVWTLTNLLKFNQIEPAILSILKTNSFQLLIEPRVRMLTKMATQKMANLLPIDSLLCSKLYLYVFEEAILKNLAKSGSLLEEDSDAMIRCIECLDLVANFALETGQLNLVLSYIPSSQFIHSENDEAKHLSSPPAVNIIELSVTFLTLLTREYFGTNSTHSKQVLSHCLIQGILAVRPYAACLNPDIRKSLLCSVILPAIDKASDVSFQRVLADTVKMWTSAELEYGDYQLLAREKMAMIVRFIKSIDRNKISDPHVLLTFYGCAEALATTNAGGVKDSELARRIEDLIMFGLKEPLLFSQVFKHLSSRCSRSAYQRLCWIHSLLHWLGAGATTSWTGFVVKLLLDCLVNDSHFEIVDCKKIHFRPDTHPKPFLKYSFCAEKKDKDLVVLRNALAAISDSYSLIDALGNFVSAQHPISKGLAHDLWIFSFQQIIRKLTQNQLREVNNRLYSFIFNEDHILQSANARPVSCMKTFMESVLPVCLDGTIELSAAAVHFAAKCFGSSYESLILLERKLHLCDLNDDEDDEDDDDGERVALDPLPNSLNNTRLNEDNEDDDENVDVDMSRINSYFEKMYMLNGLSSVCNLIGEEKYMSTLLFNRRRRTMSRVLKDALLMDCIGEYGSALALYANVMEETEQQQCLEPTNINGHLSDQQGITLFNTKYASERYVNCLRELADWDSFAHFANESNTVELLLESCWHANPVDFETIRAKFTYYEQMESKRNGWILSFYKALSYFNSVDFDIASVMRTISDGISSLTVDFLALPNINTSGCMSEEHFRILNRMQRFVEIKESMELCKILKAEGRNTSGCMSGATSNNSTDHHHHHQQQQHHHHQSTNSTMNYQLQICMLNRTWDRRILALSDSYHDWDSLLTWRALFLSQICPQTPTKRNMGLEKVAKNSPIKYIQLCRMLRITGAPLSSFLKICGLEERLLETIPITISFIAAAHRQTMKSLCELMPVLQTPNDLQPGMDILREFSLELSSTNTNNEDRLPTAHELFHAAWMNAVAPAKLHEIVNENRSANDTNDSIAAGYLASMATDRLQMILSDPTMASGSNNNNNQESNIHATYRRAVKLQHNHPRAHYLFVNRLIDDVIECCVQGKKEQKTPAELERIIRFTLNSIPLINNKFEKMQLLAERVSFLFTYDDTSCSNIDNDSLIERIHRYLLEVKDTRAFTDARTFWMLLYPKLVAQL